jgi:hypothetical protein
MKVEIILGKTNEEGILDFEEDLRRFTSEHEVSNITTTVINPSTFGERIVATITNEDLVRGLPSDVGALSCYLC